LDTNLGGTINCLEYARKFGSAVIFLSSSRVYPIDGLTALKYVETETRFELQDQDTTGASKRGVAESFPLDGHRTLYGATKLSSELLLREYIHMYGLDGVINRCGVLSGPWQMGKVDQGVIVLWAAKHYFNKSLSYIGYGGTGKQVRDVLHVEDLLELVLYQIANVRKLSGSLFNVGGGREISTSLCELTTLCEKLTGNSIPISGVPETREGDVPIYITDASQVQDVCGWKPRRSMDDIVTDIVHWIASNEQTLEPILA
jgi:CDP-paratose 2-epimerase